MPEAQPQETAIILSKTDRDISLQALHGIKMGLSGTAKAFMLTPGTRTAAGEVMQLRKQDAVRMIQSSFAVAEFASEMVRQLKWLEEKTGVKAEPQDVPAGGLKLPMGTVDLVIEDDTLLAVVEKPSTLMPGQMIQDKVPVAKVGDKVENEEEQGDAITLADLQSLLNAWKKSQAAG